MTDKEINSALSVIFDSFSILGNVVVGSCNKKFGATDKSGETLVPFKYGESRVWEDKYAVFYSYDDGSSVILNVETGHQTAVDGKLMFVTELNGVVFFDIIGISSGLKKAVVLRADTLQPIVSSLCVRGIYPPSKEHVRCIVASTLTGNNVIPYNFYIGEDFGVYHISDFIAGEC